MSESREVEVTTTITTSSYEKLRRSNFFFTINTNKSFPEGDSRREEAEELFVSALRTCLTKEEMRSYITFNREGHEFSPRFIKYININIVTEFGPSKGFLHVHGLIEVAHWSYIRFDFALLKEKIKQILGLENLYIQFRTFFDSKANILAYIEKTLK
jgi:hypothetical protein